MRQKVTRRAVLKAGAAAATGSAIGSAVPLRAFVLPADGPRFFTRDQYALVDEITEILIPADEHSGGARAAGVAAYLDGRLADEFDAAAKQQFLDGVKAVDALAQARFAGPFMRLAPDQRVAVVSEMAREERKPETPAGKFFVDLKRRTVDAYYTSRVGIHDDIQYKGNTLQAEFSGIDVSKR
jgi:hypothetical protein